MEGNNTLTNATTNTSSEPDWFLLNTSIQYTITGCLAVLVNCIILFILLRNSTLRRKSAFITGLAVGDLLDAIALLGNGVSRVMRFYNILPNGYVHPFQCMTGKGFTPVFLLGNQLPGAMFLLIGVERFVAVHYFDWYYSKWTNKIPWLCTLGAYTYCFLSVGAGYIVVYMQPDNASTPVTCGTPQVMGVYYITYNYMVSIVGGSIAAVATIIAMILFTQRRKKMLTAASVYKNHFRLQWQLTRIMLCIAMLDLAMVVLPNVLLMLANGFHVFAINDIATWSLQVICSRSYFNIIIYICINAEFRAATVKAFACYKCFPSVAVGPLMLQVPHGIVIRRSELK